MKDGIDPAVPHLLKKVGLTHIANLTSRLGIADQPLEVKPEADRLSCSVYNDAMERRTRELAAKADPKVPQATAMSTEASKVTRFALTMMMGKLKRWRQPRKETSWPRGAPIISYVGRYFDEDESDPDGLH